MKNGEKKKKTNKQRNKGKENTYISCQTFSWKCWNCGWNVEHDWHNWGVLITQNLTTHLLKLLPEEIAVLANCSKFLHACNFSCDAKFYKKKHDKKKKNWTFFLVLYYFQCPQCYFILFYFIYFGQDSFKVTINSIVLFEFLPIGFLPQKKHKSEINTLEPWHLFLTQKIK